MAEDIPRTPHPLDPAEGGRDDEDQQDRDQREASTGESPGPEPDSGDRDDSGE